jgi:hypothetical protein
LLHLTAAYRRTITSQIRDIVVSSFSKVNFLNLHLALHLPGILAILRSRNLLEVLPWRQYGWDLISITARVFIKANWLTNPRAGWRESAFLDDADEMADFDSGPCRRV